MGGAWYEVVGGIGAGVGGIGAAAGAAAAWRAASASKETGRDAADALALALAPHLVLEAFAIGESVPSEDGVWQARIANDSRFAALDVVLEAHFADGERVHREIERLAPGGVELLALREIPAPPVGPTAAQAGRSWSSDIPTSADSGATRPPSPSSSADTTAHRPERRWPTAKRSESVEMRTTEAGR